MKLNGNTANETSSTTTNEQNTEEGAKEEKQTEEDNNKLPSNENNNQVGEKTPITNNRSNNIVTVTKKSSNANLADFGFTPIDFKGFKPTQTEYSATVKSDVEQINIYAKIQDAKAKITSGTGTQKLNVGTNSFNVVVTAEDGTTKTYTLNITREETSEDTNTVNPENVEQEKKESDLTNLEVVGFTLTPTFSPDIYEYKLNVNNDVKDLDVKAEGLNNNIQIEIVGNKDLVDGENTITILVHNPDNNTNLTYQIIVNKDLAKVDSVNTSQNNAIKKANRIRNILISIVLIIIVGIIIFFIKKHKNNLEENEKYEYDEEDEDTLDLDDEEDLFKRVNKSEFKKKAVENERKRYTEILKNDEQKMNDSNNLIDEFEDDEFEDDEFEDDEFEDDEEERYFGTSKGKRKGKHF